MNQDATRAIMSLGVPDSALVVGAIRLRWNDEEFQRSPQRDRAARFSTDVGVWLSIVRNWLAGWGGDVRHAINYGATPTQVRLVLITDPSAAEFRAGGPPLHLRKLRLSGALEVQAAFAAASRGIDLPLHHQLLADARLYGEQGQHRYAVINACSAAEVALSDSARKLMAEAGKTGDEIKATLGAARGLVGLYRLNAQLNADLDVSAGQVKNQLAGPRNRVVHRGEELDWDPTKDAYKTAAALVAVSPLPTPESFIGETPLIFADGA